MQTLEQFIKDEGLTLKSKVVTRNPNMIEDKWLHRGFHYHCIIKAGPRNFMGVYFSKGSGHGGKHPDLPELLESLASDGSALQGIGSGAEYAENYGLKYNKGYDKCYAVMVKNNDQLKRLLGELAHERLLYEVEDA